MTQICPGFGVAPVPTLLSVIFRPDGVVVVAPAVWAVAAVGSRAASAPANAVTRPSTATALAGGNMRILLLLGLIIGRGLAVSISIRSVMAPRRAISRHPRRRGGPARPPGGRDIQRCHGCRRQGRRQGSSALRATSAKTAS